MIKKILLLASFKPLSPGSVYLKTLRQKGYSPLCFDMKEENEKVFNRTKNPLINNLVDPYVSRILNNRIMSIVDKYKPDMVLLQKDLSFNPETIDAIKIRTKGHLHMFDSNFKPVEEMLMAEKVFTMIES